MDQIFYFQKVKSYNFIDNGFVKFYKQALSCKHFTDIGRCKAEMKPLQDIFAENLSSMTIGTDL